MRRTRTLGCVAASALALVAVIGPSSAQAATITISPSGPNESNGFPFGVGNLWTPHLGFIYKNLPGFQLQPNDKLAFDLTEANNVPIQAKIEMAPTTVNGGDAPAAPYTQLVSNSQLAADPDGDAVFGNYEFEHAVTAPFSFPGGGLIIRFSNPGGAFASDTTGNSPLTNSGDYTDPKNLFVGRFFSDADGIPAYDFFDEFDVAAFRLKIADPVPAPPTPKKKKCKKKKKAKSAAAAKKKCKKKKGKK